MKFVQLFVAATLVGALSVPATSQAQGAQSTQGQAKVAKHTTTHAKSAATSLHAEAKISEKEARAIALKEVPTGTIGKGDHLEREGGKLVYSFDIKVPGKSGVEEVQVDALTGKLVLHEHETPQQEAAEKAKESKEHGGQSKSTKKP